MPSFKTTLVRVNNATTKAVKIIIVIMAACMVGAILLQVLMRYVFNRPPSWTEELALFLFSWSMLLMLAVGVRESFHVRMDLLIQRLPTVSSRSLQALIDVGTASFGGYLTWAGAMYALEMHGATSAAIGYPIILLYGAAPASGFLIFIFSLELLLSRHSHGERP